MLQMGKSGSPNQATLDCFAVQEDARGMGKDRQVFA